MKVPTAQFADDSALTPAPPLNLNTQLEDALTSARQEAITLRRDVDAVMRELFIAMEMTPEAADKRAAELLNKDGEPSTGDPRQIVNAEQLRADFVDLRRHVAAVMANLLLAAGRSREEVKAIVLDPLDPKAVKGNQPPETSGQELELQRIEASHQAAQTPERRQGYVPTRERARDRGHEW